MKSKTFIGLDSLESKLSFHRMRESVIEVKIKEYVREMKVKPSIPPVGSAMIRVRPSFEICIYRGKICQQGIDGNIYHMFDGFCVASAAMPYMFKSENGKYLTVDIQGSGDGEEIDEH